MKRAVQATALFVFTGAYKPQCQSGLFWPFRNGPHDGFFASLMYCTKVALKKFVIFPFFLRGMILGFNRLLMRRCVKFRLYLEGNSVCPSLLWCLCGLIKLHAELQAVLSRDILAAQLGIAKKNNRRNASCWAKLRVQDKCRDLQVVA